VKDPELRQAIQAIRDRWRAARLEKLSRRDELLAAGHDMTAVRRDRTFRARGKIVRQYARRILHLERKMNRKRAREKAK
jgi:hypothetical protein